MKLEDGLYVIPGYDGAATGGNVAVRVTNEGITVVDSKLPSELCPFNVSLNA
jgi:hypothetical protein